MSRQPIKRYDMEGSCRDEYPYGMISADDGDYVEFDDYNNLRERYKDLVMLGKDYVEISDEVLKDTMANVELAYEFRQKKEVFEQALKKASDE